MPFISASAMLSSGGKRICRWIVSITAVVLFAGMPPFADYAYAEVIDRIVAIVNNRAITLSEFREQVSQYRKHTPSATEETVLQAMINTLLLVQQARALRLEGTDSVLVRDFIEIKIKSRITIKDETLEKFYADNKGSFGGADYGAVREKIEQYLIEEETNRRLKAHLEELRAQADIRIQLTGSK